LRLLRLLKLCTTSFIIRTPIHGIGSRFKCAGLVPRLAFKFACESCSTPGSPRPVHIPGPSPVTAVWVLYGLYASRPAALNHPNQRRSHSASCYGFHRHARGRFEEHFSVKMHNTKNRYFWLKNGFSSVRNARLSARSTAQTHAAKRRKVMRFWDAQQPYCERQITGRFVRSTMCYTRADALC